MKITKFKCKPMELNEINKFIMNIEAGIKEKSTEWLDLYDDDKQHYGRDYKITDKYDISHLFEIRSIVNKKNNETELVLTYKIDNPNQIVTLEEE